MQYNTSIAQSFMVLSFASAGLLLSAQLLGEPQTPSAPRVSQNRTTWAGFPSLNPLHSRRGTEPASSAHASVPEMSSPHGASMDVASPNHSSQQWANDVVAVMSPMGLLKSLPGMGTAFAHVAEVERMDAQREASKKGARAILLRPQAGDRQNQQEHTLAKSEGANKKQDGASRGILAKEPQTELQSQQPQSPENSDMHAQLVVDLSDRELTVHRQGELIQTYSIAVGKAGWETPVGEFQVTDKDPNPTWRHPLTGALIPPGENNPLGSRWIGFWSDGIHQIGFHGTNQSQSIGHAISHGCIRLHDSDIQELYAQVELGASVVVQP